MSTEKFRSTEKIRIIWKGAGLRNCSDRFPASHCSLLHAPAPLKNPLIISPVPNVGLITCAALIQAKGQSPVVRARCPWLEERWEHLQTTMKGQADECSPSLASVGRLLFHSSCLYQTICHLQRQLKSTWQEPALLSGGRRGQVVWGAYDQELLGGVGISSLMMSAGELQERCLENIRLLISAAAHPCHDMGKVTHMTTALGFFQTLPSSCKWIWKKKKEMKPKDICQTHTAPFPLADNPQGKHPLLLLSADEVIPLVLADRSEAGVPGVPPPPCSPAGGVSVAVSFPHSCAFP